MDFEDKFNKLQKSYKRKIGRTAILKMKKINEIGPEDNIEER